MTGGREERAHNREDLAREINQHEGDEKTKHIIYLVLETIRRGNTDQLSDLFHLTRITYFQTFLPLVSFLRWTVGRMPIALLTHRPSTAAKIIPSSEWNPTMIYSGVLFDNTRESINLLHSLPAFNISMSDFRQLNPYYYLAALFIMASRKETRESDSEIPLAYKDCPVLDRICDESGIKTKSSSLVKRVSEVCNTLATQISSQCYTTALLFRDKLCPPEIKATLVSHFCTTINLGELQKCFNSLFGSRDASVSSVTASSFLEDMETIRSKSILDVFQAITKLLTVPGIEKTYKDPFALMLLQLNQGAREIASQTLNLKPTDALTDKALIQRLYLKAVRLADEPGSPEAKSPPLSSSPQSPKDDGAPAPM